MKPSRILLSLLSLTLVTTSAFGQIHGKKTKSYRGATVQDGHADTTHDGAPLVPLTETDTKSSPTKIKPKKGDKKAK